MPVSNERFFAVEGMDGVGKSTLVETLRHSFDNAITVRSPGGTPYANAVREVSRDPFTALTAKARVVAMLTATMDTSNKIVEHALATGKTVIADRWMHSVFAYAEASCFDYQLLLELTAHLHPIHYPSRVVFLDLPVAIALERELDKTAVSKEGVEYHTVVNEYFRKTALAEPDKFALIDASKNADTVAQRAINFLDPNGY